MKRLLRGTPVVLLFYFLILTSSVSIAVAQTAGSLSATSVASGTRTPQALSDAPTIKLESLIAELLRGNPELQAARKRFEASLTRFPQESALPEPRVTLGWVSNGNPLPGTGLGVEPTSNIGFQIAQELPYPGKRALKGSMARKEAESEAQMVRAKEHNLVAQLKSNFHELRFLYEAVDILQRNQGLLRRLAKVAEARYSVGKAMQQDLIKSQVEISILESKLVVIEQRKQSVTTEINALLNRPPASALGRPEPLDKTPPLEPLDLLLRQAEEASPLLRAQQGAIEGRHFGVQMAHREYYPDLDLMGGYYNQGVLKDMWEFRVEVKVPLYFWRKQRYRLEESVLRLTEAQRIYRSTEQMLSSRLRDRYLAAEASQKLMGLYTQSIVPQSKFALESSLASYETGGVDFLSVLSNLTTILDYQMSYYEQRAEYLKALASLEELVAKPLDGLNMNEVQR
jgi:cobalt-zinc-cadmium efflux system outer membrane protein